MGNSKVHSMTPLLSKCKVGVAHPVRQIQFAHNGCHLQAWLLECKFHVDRFIWLESDHQLISEAVKDCLAARQSNGRLELNADLDLAFVQCLDHTCQMSPQRKGHLQLINYTFNTTSRAMQCEAEAQRTLPALMRKGTRSHRSFWMCRTQRANVGVLLSAGTPSSSR